MPEQGLTPGQRQSLISLLKRELDRGPPKEDEDVHLEWRDNTKYAATASLARLARPKREGGKKKPTEEELQQKAQREAEL